MLTAHHTVAFLVLGVTALSAIWGGIAYFRKRNASPVLAHLLTLAQTVRPLSLAPLAATLAITGMSLSAAGVQAVSIAPFLAIRVAPMCYLAEALFVMPFLVFWPVMRRPSYAGAALWGSVAAWAMTALFAWSINRRFGTMDVDWLGLSKMTFAGMASGLLYARLVHSQSPDNGQLAITPHPSNHAR